MQPSDFERFNAVMTGMAEVHQRELSPFLLDVYWLAMKDWTLEDFEAAAGHLLQNLKWMPKPSDFTDLRKAGQPTAHEAWDTAMGNCYSWRDGDSRAGDLIDRVVRSIGGYRSLAMADVERDLPHIQRRFLEAYEDLSKVEPAREALPQIAAVGARKALRGPAPLATALPKFERETTDQPREILAVAVSLPAPARPTITVGAREKVAALARLHMDLTDEDVARISGQEIDLVREVRASALEPAL